MKLSTNPAMRKPVEDGFAHLHQSPRLRGRRALAAYLVDDRLNVLPVVADWRLPTAISAESDQGLASVGKAGGQ